jgi:hypothetical protein
MYLQGITRAREPSAAARQLAGELAARGHPVSYRAIEDWAARGLAPAPVRRSLGRGQGTVSEYLPGAADQYAAVAAVMRRGLPWQVSVLKLLSRGHLPANQDLVRQAFRDLLTPAPPEPGHDALGHAEEVAARAASGRAGRTFLRMFERNLRRARQVMEPGTDISAVATGVMATLTMLIGGTPEWSDDAIIELMAAYGIPVDKMTSDDRAAVGRFASTFAARILSGPALAQVAAQTPLDRIQAAVPRARAEARQALAGLGRAFPRRSQDIDEALTAISALMLIRIDDLGGDQAVAELGGWAPREELAS